MLHTEGYKISEIATHLELSTYEVEALLIQAKRELNTTQIGIVH